MDQDFEGIVLFKRDYREKDALVKIFTKEFGTKMFFIRHFHSKSNPLVKHLKPLTCHSYVGRINDQGLSFIKEGVKQALLVKLESDYQALAYASYISQLVDASIEDNQPDPALYDFLKQILLAINQGLSYQVLTIYTELQLLPRFGIHFNWQTCQICGRQDGAFDLSLRLQGLICSHDYPKDPFRLHLQPRILYLLRLLAQVRLEDIQSIDLTRQTIQDLQAVTDEIYKEYVGINLKGKSYLRKMAKFEADMSHLWSQPVDKKEIPDGKI